MSMKRIYLYSLLLSFSSLYCSGQSSLNRVLSSIEVNNKTLKAALQSAEVKKIDAKTGIYPQDISVDYEYMFGNDATDYQRESELTVVQGLDFPTAYYHKNKIAGMKSEQAETQYRISRRDVLLEAKNLCIELVYLNKNGAILNQRLENAEKLNQSYQKRLELGDANILETNKIALELLNVRNEWRLNNVEIENRLQKLSELNGGEAVTFSDTEYFVSDIPVGYDVLLQNVLNSDLELKSLEQDKNIAAKSVNLAKSMTLPKLNVGYKMNISNPEKFHGFVAGISIPLWENKNTVKRAKAEAVLTGMEIDNARFSQANDLKQTYDKAIVLKKACEEYRKLLSTQNNWIYLDKALSLGQISLLEYLTEINFLHQSTESFLQTERDYYLTLSELLKVDL